jgi:hypothetical protein
MPEPRPTDNGHETHVADDEIAGKAHQQVNGPAFLLITPNTPYSFVGADLRAEPLVLTLPPIEAGRYYSIQFIDTALRRPSGREVISAFLDHLKTDRPNSARSRNVRLTALITVSLRGSSPSRHAVAGRRDIVGTVPFIYYLCT